MRNLVAIGLVLLGMISMGLSFDNTEVPDIRTDVHKHLKNHSDLEKIFNSNVYPLNAVSSAYKGLARVLMAEDAFLPTTKLTYFQEGKTLIEKAIIAQPKNIELRYIRLLVQSNAPSFLGYTANIKQDLSIFLAGIGESQIAKSWKLKMMNNLLETNGLTSSQRNDIQSKLNKFTTS